MNIKFLRQELDALLDINKDTIEKLIEREDRLQIIEQKSLEAYKMSMKFKEKSRDLIPWYWRYKYNIGSVSLLTITLILFI